jgi:hypothetical protein
MAPILTGRGERRIGGGRGLRLRSRYGGSRWWMESGDLSVLATGFASTLTTDGGRSSYA